MAFGKERLLMDNKKGISREEKIKKWASIIVNHSLAHQFESKCQSQTLKDKMIVIQGETSSQELQIALEEEIIRQGGYPVLTPFFPNHQRRNLYAGLPAFQYGTENQIANVPQFAKAMFEEMDGYVTILGAKDPHKFKNYADKLTIASKAGRHLIDIRVQKPWTLTYFPTEGNSEDEGISHEEYFNFVVDASSVDYEQMEKDLAPLEQLLTDTSEIVVRSHHRLDNRICELSMNKGKQVGLSCFGTHNLPDGEVYTSPNANSLNGEIFLDIPVHYGGGLIGGVYLKFENGRIIQYNAGEGQEFLTKVIETDDGSHQIGEFALGTNTQITRNFKEILFAEKIGGSIHMAIGSSYTEPYRELQGLKGEELDMAKKLLIETGKYSFSAQHLDIPKDFRNPVEGEAIFFDGKEVKWDGNNWTW